MGCLVSKLFPQNSSPNNANEMKFKFSEIVDQSCPQYEPDFPLPLPSKPLNQISSSSSSTSFQKDQSRVQLHTPIYVATRPYHETKPSHISFDKDDEMELIEEINSYELRVNHLRSGLAGIIPKALVRLDIDTPLRLAVKDRGTIQRCLMQYNLSGAYVIRRCGSNPNDFVISISQYNEERDTFDWHYSICINPSNKCFYFPQETPLKNMYFSSFQQLIADKHVRNVIPLTEILPYSIEFDEELWKIPYEELTIGCKIGEGQFGEVSRANWHKDRRTIPVAIKKLHILGVTSVIEREIEAMKQLRNLYIVTLHGISQCPTTNEILMVTEFMENGDLKSWLKNQPKLPKYSTLLRFATGITNGMVYLEFRNYVHRDLACRNILLGRNTNFVKIADFGLSTILHANDVNQRQQDQFVKLPVRSLAPELLNNHAAYSIKSDVWAFGILLIELWLKGGDPYDEEHPAWVQAAVKNRHVHEKPVDCPDHFYKSVICRCLEFEANDRPSFSALRQLLGEWKC